MYAICNEHGDHVQIHHLSIEIVGESPKHTLDTFPAYPIRKLQDVKVLMRIQADFIQL